MKRSTIVVALAAALATLVAATAAFAGGQEGRTLFRYVGQLQSSTGSSVTITVQAGNRPALRSMLGQPLSQTFATDAKTVFLKWANGVPTVVPVGELSTNDYVTVNVRASHDAPLATVVATPANIVGDHGPTLVKPSQPLYLFRGTLVSTVSGKVTIQVKGGDRRALRLMIGQQAEQTFSTSGETVFLHWDHRTPSVSDPATWTPGDRIVIRVRADRGSTLEQVKATPARRVADREPKSQEQAQTAQA
jgi:hypothetical protein